MINYGKWSQPGVPHKGWECIGVTDLGEPSQICEMCERQIIRYVHYMRHPGYPAVLECGCICAGYMAEDPAGAKERESRLRKRRRRRRQNWVMVASSDMRDLKQIADKLAQLALLMLSSDKDGEQLAAIGAIKRTLQSLGADQHDFAEWIKHVNGKIPESEMQRIYNAGKAEGIEIGKAEANYNKAKRRFDDLYGNTEDEFGPTASAPPKEGHSIRSAKLKDTIRAMRAKCTFPESSEQFLSDLLDRADQFDPVFFSDKQKKWFIDLMRRAKAQGAAI